MDTLGTRIKFARGSRGISLKEMGDHFGVPKSTVWRWEDDTLAGTVLANLANIADYLGASRDWIAFGGPPDPSGYVEFRKRVAAAKRRRARKRKAA